VPRPPILPTVDWQTVFYSGLEYDRWLDGGESPDNQRNIESARQALVLEPHVTGLLAALARPVHVIAIAEDWCGDVVRHVPILQKLAEASSNLTVRYIRRGQHPDVFARFLTNGGEAIPKFIFLNDTFVECGSWGPMPELCREIIARGKACNDVPAARKKVSGLYEADHNFRMVIAELLRLIDIAASREP
jgi:hypothetical protein